MSKEIYNMKGAIVHSVRWVAPKSGKFKNYIKYIDRDEATRNYKFDEFSLYNDYMGNPQKSGSLFTNEKDFMNKREIRELKNNFELAQKNKSMMWQDVFSFRNEWLIENGYLDPKSGVLDERKIRSAIRKSMSELYKEKGENELIWSASIHYNTKHIHVHVASVELKPNKEELKVANKKRGMRKLSTLKTMKSKFINDMRNRDDFYRELDVLARDNMIGSKKEYEFMKDRILREKMLKLLKHIPKNKREWNYERAKEARSYLNAITKYYLENFCKDDYKKFKELLEWDKEEQIRIYGIPKDERKLKEEHYKEKDLYKRMGNTILKELKDFINKEEYKNRRLEYLDNKKKFKKGIKYKKDDKKILKNETSNYTEKEISKDNLKEISTSKENINLKKEGEGINNIKDGEKGIEIVVPEKEEYFINKQGVKIDVNEATEEKQLIDKGKLEVIEGEVSFNKGYVYDISQTVSIGDKKIGKEEIKELLNENSINQKVEDKRISELLKNKRRYSNANISMLINNIKRSMRNDLEHYLNMREFERMELQKEYESGRE